MTLIKKKTYHGSTETLRRTKDFAAGKPFETLLKHGGNGGKQAARKVRHLKSSRVYPC
jgi:hypothetical protein